MTRQLLWVILSLLPEEGRRGDETEGQGRRRKMNDTEETEEIKTFLLYPYLLQGEQALPNCNSISIGSCGDVKYTTPLPHPTTPNNCLYMSASFFKQTDCNRMANNVDCEETAHYIWIYTVCIGFRFGLQSFKCLRKVDTLSGETTLCKLFFPPY